MHASDLHAQILACIRKPGVSLAFYFPKINLFAHKKLYFPFQHLSSQFLIWLDPKPTIGLRISSSLGNGGPSHKGYKMQCLLMPLFWFVRFANEIKRIRDKTFCFDIRLGPNPRTQHTKHIHGPRCNSTELCGIHMSEFPPLLLRKRKMIGSLSQNLFFQL